MCEHVGRVKRANYNCVDCKVDTSKINEFYVVKNHIWKKHGVKKRMLCVGCLEKRLNRKLTPDDFYNHPINRGKFQQSERLRDRCGVGNKCIIFPEYYIDTAHILMLLGEMDYQSYEDFVQKCYQWSQEWSEFE